MENTIIDNMKYLQPQVEVLSIFPEGVVCDSPVPGANEGVGYEEW